MRDEYRKQRKSFKRISILFVIVLIITFVPASTFAVSKASNYSKLFTKKWYSAVHNECKGIYDDYVLYPDATERECRWIYDALCDEYRKTRNDTPTRTTNHIIKTGLFVTSHIHYWVDGRYEIVDKKEGPTFTSEDIRNSILKPDNSFYDFYSFKELCVTNGTTWHHNYDTLKRWSENMCEFSGTSFFPDLDEQTSLLGKTSSFYKLSDAMQVYAIDKSDYFECRYSRNGKYGMIYKKSASGCTNKMSKTTRLKNLYKNKAQGVCHDYSNYEETYFRSVGLKAWYRSSDKIEHAWTVVKAKNSKGKTLWIPFDYSIGPAKELNVKKSQKKYINTEAKRYKLYLKGLSGAPNYKNFTDADFN